MELITDLGLELEMSFVLWCQGGDPSGRLPPGEQLELNHQVIQNGTPQQVYELTRIAIEKGKKAPRGFFLMPGCELPVMSPAYNVYTMMKAISDFGFYG